MWPQPLRGDATVAAAGPAWQESDGTKVRMSHEAAGPLVLAVPDKFRGSATAEQLRGAIGRAACTSGWRFRALPLADGGEGLLECFGGANRRSVVLGPLGGPLSARWRLAGRTAVIEMAEASGLCRTGGLSDPLRATTTGTGELIEIAIRSGARTIVVGAGGSATTDGGLGAIRKLEQYRPLDGSRGYRVIVAADVTTHFIDAAIAFGAQKGADAAGIERLRRRLVRLTGAYRSRYGVDIVRLAGGGAAGGLAGGLAALGARIRPGFDVVAEQTGLLAAIAEADLVISGEGQFDSTSYLGKAVGSVVRLCAQRSTPVALICGYVDPKFDIGVPTVSLVERFGRSAAFTRTLVCVEEAATAVLNTARRQLRPSACDRPANASTADGESSLDSDPTSTATKTWRYFDSGLLAMRCVPPVEPVGRKSGLLYGESL